MGKIIGKIIGKINGKTMGKIIGRIIGTSGKDMKKSPKNMENHRWRMGNRDLVILTGSGSSSWAYI
jgi:hypothetical protein